MQKDGVKSKGEMRMQSSLRGKVLDSVAVKWSRGNISNWEEFKKWMFENSENESDKGNMILAFTWIEETTDTALALAAEEAEKRIKQAKAFNTHLPLDEGAAFEEKLQNDAIIAVMSELCLRLLGEKKEARKNG